MTRASLLLTLTACIQTLPPAGRRPRLRSPEPFAYEGRPAFGIEDLEPDGCPRSRVTYPAWDPTDTDNPVVAAELRCPPATRGLILILPILGDDYGPPDAFADHLCRSGFATLRFERKLNVFDPGRDFAHVARAIRRGVVDVRRSLEWDRVPELRGSGGVGILGISMGSFIATGVAASDHRIGAAVLALGGGDLVDILGAARAEPEIDAFYDALERRGLGADAIELEAHRALDPLDPMRFAKSLDPTRVLMVHARFDAVVPYENGTLLWRAAGRPRRIVLLAGHYSAGLYIGHLLDETERHFTRHLARR
jgi:hypothetical protein